MPKIDSSMSIERQPTPVNQPSAETTIESGETK